MTRHLQAIYENGILRPLESLPLKERQQVALIVSDQGDGKCGEDEWLDVAFLRYLEQEADDSVTLEQVHSALQKIPGSMVEDFRRERDERF